MRGLPSDGLRPLTRVLMLLIVAPAISSFPLADLLVLALALVVAVGLALYFLLEVVDWQNSIRARVGMAPVDAAHPAYVALIALIVFTPLWIAGLGFAANAGLNALFIYGFGWGISGSAVGTVVAQWAMVGAYAWVVGALARRHAASVRPQREGLRGSARSGGWLSRLIGR